MAKTLTTLIADTRQKANIENNVGMFPDTVLTSWINEGIKYLYQEIVAKDESFALQSPADFVLTSTATGNSVALPADFFRGRGLDIWPDTTRVRSIPEYNFAERNRHGYVGHRFDGLTLYVLPWTMAAGTYRLYYVPDPPQLVAGSDVLDVNLSRMDEFISLYAAIQAMDKREQDTATKERRLAALIGRLGTVYGNRQSEPGQAPIMRVDSGLPWGFSRGSGDAGSPD